MRTRPGDTPLTRVASLLVLGAGLTALFLDVNDWWLIFLIGYAVIVPIVSILSGEEGEDDDVLGDLDRRMDETLDGALAGPRRSEEVPPSKRDALETLRERYAQGELSEAQFEEKLERLLDTETLEDARARVGRATDEDREFESERE
ncbi:SHOCT domain-containing protein [Haloarchaeobius sp. DT45]|uniref:SHOCT domain-containing protein n=1 Tax=Haloarchaeobius sp. DT45 TaxID=3446116 RepID=UPI003F6B30EC